VLHGPPDSITVDVASKLPKLSPDTVTDAPPLCGEFSLASDSTGASKLSPEVWVPTATPTVTLYSTSAVVTLVSRQASDVADDHAVVAQAASPTAAVAVNCSPPKLSPTAVTDDCPLDTALRASIEASGASNVTFPTHVPAIAPTVKCT
jgi:hypothetical protein